MHIWGELWNEHRLTDRADITITKESTPKQIIWWGETTKFRAIRKGAATEVRYFQTETSKKVLWVGGCKTAKPLHKGPLFVPRWTFAVDTPDPQREKFRAFMEVVEGA